MRILAVGGGSGGHVTPAVAVLREIKKSHPRVELQFWCDRKFSPQASRLMADFDDRVLVGNIFAGKLRRYNHLTIWRQLLWPTLVLRNIGDLFLVILGFIQSLTKLILWRPDVIFAKGGYVCLPVGVAAQLLRIPIVIHDSDAHPGLTNRILGRWATKIATGAPLEYYDYPADRAKYVGIPIGPEFHEFSDKERKAAKKRWGINTNKPLLVITGGGLGASRINDTVVAALKDLMKLSSVILVSGNLQYDELNSITPENSNDFQLHSFVSKDMASLLGAADVVVARAGATTILELAALARPTILVPNAKLTGGHQLKNASVYQKQGAAVVLDEDSIIKNPQSLVSVVETILSDNEKTKKMTRIFNSFARPNAARDVANMILASIK